MNAAFVAKDRSANFEIQHWNNSAESHNEM